MGEFLGRNMDEVARFFAEDLKFPQLFVRVALLKSRAWGLDTVSTVSNLQLWRRHARCTKNWWWTFGYLQSNFVTLCWGLVTTSHSMTSASQEWFF